MYTKMEWEGYEEGASVKRGSKSRIDHQSINNNVSSCLNRCNNNITATNFSVIKESLSDHREEEKATDLSSSGSNNCFSVKSSNGLNTSGTSSLTTSSISNGVDGSSTGTTKKHKPIPPPLDLSIGAANLSLNNHQAILNSPSCYLGSPKYTQSDKSLPLRKRWHSWSPILMNGQDDSLMLPLYGTDGLTKSGDNNGSNPGSRNAGCSPPTPSTLQLMSGPPPLYHHQTSPYVPSAYSMGRPFSHHHNSTHGGGSTGSNSGSNASSNASSMSPSLQTPPACAFFAAPNDPSPKFMNSPVFTYSLPEPSILYQGPFSPIRTTSGTTLASLYPPPSSPFTNLSLGSPLNNSMNGGNNNISTTTTSSSSSTGGNSNNGSSSNNSNNSSSGVVTTTTATGGNGGSNNGGVSSNSNNTPCFNMIPSTLLSPAPSQASTNSLSYEDLAEKSINLFNPAWSIFMSGTKVRFVGAMNSMDWYFVEFLADSGESLGFKGEYAPHGLEVRKFVVTSSAKERIQITFCPVADPHHAAIEVNCEPGHPFMVEKKGWCAVKPEAFHETYGTSCQPLECGDICLNISNIRNQSHHQQQQQQMQHVSAPPQQIVASTPSSLFSSTSSPSAIIISHNNSTHNGPMITVSSSSLNGMNPSGASTSTSLGMVLKMEPIDEMSVASVENTHLTHNLMGSPSLPPPQGPRMGSGGSYGHVSKKLNLGNGMSTPSRRQKDSTGEAKGRRPMNAFLLFAKDKRPELIQMYPGKDNRSISVLLGEAWQSLAPSEKEKYASSAKARAEEQKRIHPDCWKRKRSQSTHS